MVKIIQIGNPILEKKSKKVRDIKSQINQKIINDLVDTCKKKDKSTVGLAAPQIGKNLRKFTARRLDIEEEYRKKRKEMPKKKKQNIWDVIVNPKIIKLGKKKEIFWEGCLSIEKGKIYGPVERPSFVKIEYLDKEGNKKLLSAVGFFAHLLQHEIDHLDGILFVKHIKNPDNLWKSSKLDKFLKEHGKYPEIVN